MLSRVLYNNVYMLHAFYGCTGQVVIVLEKLLASSSTSSRSAASTPTASGMQKRLSTILYAGSDARSALTPLDFPYSIRECSAVPSAATAV